MSETRSTEQKLAGLFAEIWQGVVDGIGLDSGELDQAMERTGLAEWRACTEAEAALTDGEYAAGDTMMFLTDEGKRVMELAKGNT